ncbi:MAG: hypothetical protein LBO74_04175 [Candidatus Symbiothrix sp.]|jgi:hypothetical protein|nr:hypothetical protein [Candidatus Symbiothrix sp.]
MKRRIGCGKLGIIISILSSIAAITLNCCVLYNPDFFPVFFIFMSIIGMAVGFVLIAIEAHHIDKYQDKVLNDLQEQYVKLLIKYLLK